MRARRTDDNQTEIVNTFRKLGCSVHVTSMLGDGFPDVVVGFRGINYLVEIKDGTKKPSARKLTPDEQIWHDQWRGQVCIVQSIQDVIDLVGYFDRNEPLERKQGEYISDHCPYCNCMMIGNVDNEKWCANPSCDYGIIVMVGDCDVQPK